MRVFLNADASAPDKYVFVPLPSVSIRPFDVDEVFFLQGANKATILKSFGANIFFDDQDVHGMPASEVVPSARVPYKKGQEPK